MNKSHPRHTPPRLLATALLTAAWLALAPVWAQPLNPLPAAQPSTASSSPPDAADIQRRINAVGRRGFLFEAVRGPRKLFLYGTPSAGKDAYFPLNAAVLQALAQSNRLLTERNPSNPQEDSRVALSLGSLPQGEKIGRYLPQDVVARLNEVVPQLGFVPERLQQLKPWLLATVLDQEFLVRSGYQPQQNPLLYFVGYARDRKLPLGEFEGIAGQYRLLDSLPISVQVDALDQTLRGIISGQTQLKHRLLIDQGWANGNIAATMQVVNADQNATGPWASFYAQTWLTARSLRLATSIDQDMAQAGSPFIAIDATNLLGANGVAAELVKLGYLLRDLQSP